MVGTKRGRSDGRIESELRRVRQAAGRSLRSVAAEIPVDPAFLSKMERGLVTPSDRVLIRALEVLGADEVVELLRERGSFMAALTSVADKDTV